MSVAWVAVGAAALGTIASLDAAKGAASDQADATRDATDATLQAQREAQAAQKPFLEGGYAATNRLRELLGLGGDTGAAGYGSANAPFKFDGSDLQNEPGYQFQLQQGQQALDRKAAAGGGFYSGEGLRGAAAYNQGLAGTTFNDAYNRQFNAFQTNRANTLNPLQALAGQGQTAANTSGQIGMSGANSLAGLMTNNANSQGAAGIAGANAVSGGINSGLTAWQRAQMINKLNTTPAATSNFQNAAWWAGGPGWEGE